MHDDHVFDLDAGRVCLDFANTLSSSGNALDSYPRLVAFAEQSNLLTHTDAEWLRSAAQHQTNGASEVLERVQRVRAAIYAIFSAVARGQTASDQDLDTLNAELAAVMNHARLTETGSRGHYGWGWQGRALDMPLWGVVRSAADLLTSETDRQLVRECGASDCRWLFMDTSKNRSRQWCSMRSCGNREKARRHYARSRRRSAAPVEADVKR